MIFKLNRICLFLGILVLCNAVSANESEYKKFWQLFSQVNDFDVPGKDREKLAEEYKAYVNSLSADEVFQIAKQTSESLPKELSEDGYWGMYIILNYFQEKGGLNDIRNSLEEIKDANNNIPLRITLTSSFRKKDWREKLSVEQLDSVMETVNPLIPSNQHKALRDSAIRTSYQLTGELDKRYILSDPLAKQQLNKGESERELIRAVRKGKAAVSEKYINNRQKVLSYYNELAQSLIPIINDPCESRLIQTAVYYAKNIAINNFEVDSEQAIKDTLKKALANYNQYDKILWRPLVRTNIECGNEQAEQTLQEMLDNTNVDYSTKDDLKYIKRKIEKGEIKPRPEKLSSIKVSEIPASPQIPEPNAEDVNEVIDWLEQIWAEDKQLREELDPNQVRLLLETLKEQKQQLE